MRAWRAVDKLGVVIHGPEVIDSGNCLRILKYLEKFGQVAAVLGGTMGRVAVIDSRLQDSIDISTSRTPSLLIRDLQSASDLVILLNQAKTRESGLAFGSRIASRIDPFPPVLQIDCGGKFIAWLAGNNNEFFGSIARDLERYLGFDIITIPQNESTVSRKGNQIIRRIVGVFPGENISINGTVVAKAIDSIVDIFSEEGIIRDIHGAEIKHHGIGKLSFPLDLENAIIRSGSIRRTVAKLKTESPDDRLPFEIINSDYDCRDLTVFIDHCAEKTFEIAKAASAAVTIGDDTTAIAGDILFRLGIPVIGIVDGDLDHLSKNTSITKGSLIIRVEAGYDDKIGYLIKKDLFHGEDKIHISLSDLINAAIALAGDRIVDINRS